MKTRNHILIAVVLMVSIVPSLAYAAWNPFSWFSWLKQANQPRAVQNKTNTYATSTPTATTTLEATGSTLKLGADKQPALSDQTSEIEKLKKQIIDIKTQYYADTAAAQSYGGSQSSVDGQIQNLTNAANLKIQKIQLQEQQLYLDYQNNLSNL